ncbi:Aminoacylase-1 [Geodia barretti]|uniref:N-acyl-aliphatic-L-amino acid amidohydrolase n=1 Tax=Geodia barretti TaxID=519541 RepID=A0AA35VR62_GEOBA|nr:Aminoacylase-1 [Geodia barretti]
MASAQSPPAKKSRSKAVLNGDSCTEAVNGKTCVQVATNADTPAEDPAVTLFREYIRIPSISRGDNYLQHYAEAVKFIQTVADDIGLPHELIEVTPANKIVLITVEGTHPELKSVLLNSHYDVVPVFPDCWKYDAFAAHKDENGDIYGRGTQDMKCCIIWHLEALRRLKKSGVKFSRTLYITAVPDEEMGGMLGMALFIKTERFKKMNVAFALDEGLANPTEAMSVYYGERSAHWIEVTCPGNPGHGSRFIENTAVEKVEKLLRQALALPTGAKDQVRMSNATVHSVCGVCVTIYRLEGAPCLKLGDVTTINVTEIHGGITHNVVPNKFVVVLDMRFSPHEDHQEILRMVQGWLDEAGEGCTLKFIQESPKYPMTSTDDSDPWWRAFSTTCDKHSLKLEKEIFPAGTDSRYLRTLGIPCLGFSPLNHTPILLHDHNERLNERVFLRGIDIFVDLLPALCNVETTV